MKTYIANWLVCTSLIFSCAANAFGENESAEKKSVIDKIAGTNEAYAMEIPAPQTPLKLPTQKPTIQIQDESLFYRYINSSSDSRYSCKEPTREEFEKVPLYRGYYVVNDKKDELEEKVTEPINSSKWKDYVGIDKISTKMDSDKVRTKLKFKDVKKIEIVINVDAKPEEGVYTELKTSYKW